MTAMNPDTSRQAVVEAALVLLQRMGLTPADLAAVPQDHPELPTFAEYVPVVSAAVSAGTRRAYGSYWNRIVEHWGHRRLDEPTPSEIRQLMVYVKTHVVARRNARGGRSAKEHLVAALRCLYRRAVDDGLITEAGNPARKVAKPRRLPTTRRALPDARLAEINQIAATTGDDPELDTLILRLHTETACRRGGALALRPRDLDPDQCLILLREKGETVRWQPVSPTLMDRLIEHGQERHAPEDGQLLRYAHGRPITYRRYDHLWRRIGRHVPWVATQGISTHWIRHTILTWVEGRGVASDATFREKREDTRPALQLPRRSRRAGRVRRQCGGDLRCQDRVASTERMLNLLPLHPVTRMMRQMQRKSAATRKDATTVRSSRSGIRQGW
jgi:site-specific recombinase XerD